MALALKKLEEGRGFVLLRVEGLFQHGDLELSLDAVGSLRRNCGDGVRVDSTYIHIYGYRRKGTRSSVVPIKRRHYFCDLESPRSLTSAAQCNLIA